MIRCFINIATKNRVDAGFYFSAIGPFNGAMKKGLIPQFNAEELGFLI